MAGERAEGALRFDRNAVIQGIPGRTFSGQEMVALGGGLAGWGKIALGHWGGAGSRMLAQGLSVGVTAGGGRALCHDLETPAQAAWLARAQGIVSVFAEQEGKRVFLHFFDRDGLSLSTDKIQKLEQELQSPSASHMEGSVGECVHLHTTPGDYAADAVRLGRLYRRHLRVLMVAVPGDSPAERSVRSALSLLGCSVVRDWKRGIPAFGVEHGGFYLTAQDERGALLEPEQLLPLVCLIEMENGGGRVAVPDEASAAVDLVAAGLGGTVMRLGRDGEKARELYAALPWLRDGVFAAVRICQRMLVTGESLENLMGKTPRFAARRREVPLTADGAEVMGELARERGRELTGGGLHFRSGSGWVHLAPLERRRALRVVAEGPDLELAAELCDFYADLCVRTDKRLREQRVEN